ncbi:GntR family transcriptional regulator [Leucothrix pacifica]|uniref:GntR family transcriptional regulator n=1 Tax=Leucothrix pacifica TaxID=1247513 RepID=A0A317CU69_9GAMM|nr:GntR family transcriptional regulator [Leucothrix pacifica]PWQ99872.1 GntR family transcriptional regulator [Leucothrix pacifica]
MLTSLERPKTLKETSLERLREAITMGYFLPGERLVERTLCEQLGVSRTVIRECIQHLESEQLITVVPNAGPSVATLNPHEVQEIYEIRTMLESAAIASCAAIASETTVATLEAYCDKIARSLLDHDIKQALVDTRMFYHTIFSEGEKWVAWDLVERLNGRIGQLRAVTLSSKGRSTAGPRNLRAITAAIKQQDPDTAAEACAKHLQQAMTIALNELQKPKEDVLDG